jgi:hypothetical protein
MTRWPVFVKRFARVSVQSWTCPLPPGVGGATLRYLGDMPHLLYCVVKGGHASGSDFPASSAAMLATVDLA